MSCSHQTWGINGTMSCWSRPKLVERRSRHGSGPRMSDSLAEVEFDRQSDGEALGDRPHQQSSAWACTGAPAGMLPPGWDPVGVTGPR